MFGPRRLYWRLHDAEVLGIVVGQDVEEVAMVINGVLDPVATRDVIEKEPLGSSAGSAQVLGGDLGSAADQQPLSTERPIDDEESAIGIVVDEFIRGAGALMLRRYTRSGRFVSS